MAPEDPSRNIRFIQEIKKHQCIYNFSLPEYTKKHATESAWQEIADEMNDTVHNCKEKWKNLRTVFVRKMKPLPPTAPSKKTNKPYYLEDAMQFLLPFVRANHAITTNSPDRLSNPAHTRDAKEDKNIESEDCDELSEPSPLPRESDWLNDWIECPPTTNPSTRQSRKKKRNDCNGSSGDYTFFDAKKARTNNNYNGDGGDSDGDDPRKLFLLSLLPDVHAMTDVQMRKFRKLVLDAVDTVLDETPNGMIHTHTPTT